MIVVMLFIICFTDFVKADNDLAKVLEIAACDKCSKICEKNCVNRRKEAEPLEGDLDCVSKCSLLRYFLSSFFIINSFQNLLYIVYKLNCVLCMHYAGGLW